jgi:hypothetical protein
LAADTLQIATALRATGKLARFPVPSCCPSHCLACACADPTSWRFQPHTACNSCLLDVRAADAIGGTAQVGKVTHT